MNVVIIYGSTTGVTKDVSETLGGFFNNCDLVDVANVDNFEDFKDKDLIILGGSTWGIGDLQDDWLDKIELLGNSNLTSKKFAIFGLGDQEGYPDSFVDGVGEIYDAVVKAGGLVIGATSTEGYQFDDSKASRNNLFSGLILDEDNQGNLTEERISNWVKLLKEELQ